MRFDANEFNTMRRPLAEMSSISDDALPWRPSERTEARTVFPVARFLKKTSRSPFVSPLTRLVAIEEKATKPPPPARTTAYVALLACLLFESVETLVVVPEATFRT